MPFTRVFDDRRLFLPCRWVTPRSVTDSNGSWPSDRAMAASDSASQSLRATATMAMSVVTKYPAIMANHNPNSRGRVT